MLKKGQWVRGVKGREAIARGADRPIPLPPGLSQDVRRESRRILSARPRAMWRKDEIPLVVDLAEQMLLVEDLRTQARDAMAQGMLIEHNGKTPLFDLLDRARRTVHQHRRALGLQVVGRTSGGQHVTDFARQMEVGRKLEDEARGATTTGLRLLK